MRFLIKTTEEVIRIDAEAIEVTEDGSILLFRDQDDVLVLTLPRDNFKFCLKEEVEHQ